MKDKLFDALKQSQADYTDIRFELEDSVQIACKGAQKEVCEPHTFSRGIVRCCTKGGWGISTFESDKDLIKSVSEASESAAKIGKHVTELANAEIVGREIKAEDADDFRIRSTHEKLKVVSGYYDMISKSNPAIVAAEVKYRDSFKTVYFASSRGSYFVEERPRMCLKFFAVAREGDLIQKAGENMSFVSGFTNILRQEELAKSVAIRAVDLLRATSCPGGVYSVILDQELGGVLAHETIGHLSEADLLYENQKIRELMIPGRIMGLKQLNIIDDGTIPHHVGTQTFDDEGTPTRKTYLIREGILTSHLHSLETAAKMSASPTGNARAINGHNPPIVRMTNTYISPGDSTLEELILGVERGIYACKVPVGKVNLDNFSFSAAYGYMIEHGKLGELIRDISLEGNVFETLNNIDGFGNDLKMIQGGGGCGKGNQSPLPVTFGSPHIRVQNMTVKNKPLR